MSKYRALYQQFAAKRGLTICSPDDLTLISKDWHSDDPNFSDQSGAKFRNRKRIDELISLAVPPAWQNVRFAQASDYHIQAIGYDAKKRTQYRYHPNWELVRDDVKALRIREIGLGLPKLRAAVSNYITGNLEELMTVSAIALRLIDNQLVRVGNEQYVENGTSGCATLPNSAFIKKGGKSFIKYTGKSGQKTELQLKDPQLIERIAQLNGEGGPRLFTFMVDGEPQILGAKHINKFIKNQSGRDFSAKDFRTFRASAVALSLLCDDEFEPEKKAKQRVTSAVRFVSQRLNNTPAVCRSSYIHPKIINAYMNDGLDSTLMKSRKRKGLSRGESALMRFLQF